MMWDERFSSLIGLDKYQIIQNNHIVVCGLGGVGSYVIEALVRSGVKEVTIVDYDVVDETNINRQLIALNSTVQEYKTDVVEKRINDINPHCIVHKINQKLTLDNINQLFTAHNYTYFIDAIDNIDGKVGLCRYCQQNNLKIICATGMGKRMHPEMVEITRLDKTYQDHLAKAFRLAIRKNNLTDKITVAFSREIPLESGNNKVLASSAFVPSTAGLMMAAYVVNDLLEKRVQKIIVAGGCFWGVEEYYKRVKGILSTKVGYAQSKQANPKYEIVKTGVTNACEAVELEYDNQVISLEKICELLFRIIDPTSLNHQGEDFGTQYRTGIYYQNNEEQQRILQFLEQRQLEYSQEIKVECAKIKNFYSAEEYHQKYLEKNPTGYCHVDFSKLKDEEKKEISK